MKEDLANGKISRKEAEYLHNDLRNKTSAPEDITPENVESALEYLGFSGFEYHLREKSILEKRAAEGELAVKELELIKNKEKELRIEKGIFRAKLKIGFLISISIIFLITVYYLSLTYILNSYVTPTDSPLAIFGVAVTILLGTIPLFSLRKAKIFFIEKYNTMVKEL